MSNEKFKGFDKAQREWDNMTPEDTSEQEDDRHIVTLAELIEAWYGICTITRLSFDEKKSIDNKYFVTCEHWASVAKAVQASINIIEPVLQAIFADAMEDDSINCDNARKELAELTNNYIEI